MYHNELQIMRHGFNVGDLAKYMSRIILIVDIDDEWVHGIELGETHIAKYKGHVLKQVSHEDR